MIADAGDWLPDILEEHASELPFLWIRRTEAWRPPGFSVRALVQHDERLDAHTDALALAREEALPVLLPMVESGDPLADKSLGPERFLLVGRLGNPALVELLLQAMESKDAMAAACAATAFRTLTGVLVESGQFVELDDGQIPIPDAALARARWQEMERGFEKITRLCHGVDVQQGLPSEALSLFDLPSVADGRLRDFFHGRWEGGPAMLDAFPFRG